MEAFHDDIVVEIASFLGIPSDLLSLALVSKRFGAKPPQNNEGYNYGNINIMDESCKSPEVRDWSLMEEAARTMLETYQPTNEERTWMTKLAGESWIVVCHEFRALRKLGWDMHDYARQANKLFNDPRISSVNITINGAVTTIRRGRHTNSLAPSGVILGILFEHTLKGLLPSLRVMREEYNQQLRRCGVDPKDSFPDELERFANALNVPTSHLCSSGPDDAIVWRIPSRRADAME